MNTSSLGYTLIPTFIFDEWLTLLSDVEIKIVVFIACQISRSGKASVALSNAEIAKRTGLSEQTLRAGLPKLEKSGFLVAERDSAAQAVHYHLGAGPSASYPLRKGKMAQ